MEFEAYIKLHEDHMGSHEGHMGSNVGILGMFRTVPGGAALSLGALRFFSNVYFDVRI